jgi:hypothetical protein
MHDFSSAVPEAYPELALPARVQDWNDDHALIFLTQRGSDAIGNLILGAESVDRYLSGAHGSRIVPSEDRATEYPALAQAAMLGAPPASSVHGEHPKFSTGLARGAETINTPRDRSFVQNACEAGRSAAHSPASQRPQARGAGYQTVVGILTASRTQLG